MIDDKGTKNWDGQPGHNLKEDSISIQPLLPGEFIIFSCRNYKKYKAMHRPKCACIPCREKYIDKLSETHEANVKALVGALEWYKSEATAIKRNYTKDLKNEDLILASLTVLSLDGGDRAEKAIKVIQ